MTRPIPGERDKPSGGLVSARMDMTRFTTRAACVTGVMVCLAGCMGGPPAPEPAMLETARNLSSQAETSAADGKHAEACSDYAKALEIYRSADYGPGIVRSLLNLAAVRLQAGDRAGARDCLHAARRYEASVAASNPAELQRGGMGGLLAEVAWLEARMDADDGKIGSAWAALTRGHANAGRMSDGQSGRYAAMEARLHLAAGEFRNAESSAAKSLSSYHSAGDARGVADAMRYRGKALAGMGNHKEAFACFDAALETDQKHARAAKVKDDLLGMSHAAAAMGDAARAHACAERAAKISAARIPSDRE